MRMILIVEIVFVVGVLGYLFFGSYPKQILPLQGEVIMESDFIFEIENGNSVVVSMDKDFLDSFVLNEDSDFVFIPGIYYWKVIGDFKESGVRSFVVSEDTSINFRDVISDVKKEILIPEIKFGDLKDEE